MEFASAKNNIFNLLKDFMDVSIVIVSYNVREYLVPCIESIYKHIKPKYNFEIIVVDNNSKDGTISALSNSYKDIILIRNNANLGYTKASNQGAGMSKGRYIFFLNPDTKLHDDVLSNLIEKVKNEEKFGAVGPLLKNDNDVPQQSFWRFPNLRNTILSIYHLDFFNFKKNYKYSNFSQISSVDSISGGALLTKKSIFENLNGFNEKLFWMEDIDYCLRLTQNDLKVFVDPTSSITHYQGKSAQKNFKISISNQLLSKVRYFKIHHTNISAFIILISVEVSLLIKILIHSFLAPFSKTKKLKLKAYVYTLMYVFENFIEDVTLQAK